MPVHADGYLIPFTAPQVAAMQIETANVRDFAHYVESRRVDENVMTRQFWVKFSERFNFCEHVLGDSRLWDDAGTTKLSRLLPDSTFGRHPESTQIIATRIPEIRGARGTGIDNAGQFPQFPKALVEVFYEQFGGTITSDAGTANEKNRFTSRGAGHTDVEAFTLPGGAFKYTAAGGGGGPGGGPPIPVPFNVSFTRPVRHFTITWHHLPNTLYETDGALFRRLYLGTGDGIPWLGCVNRTAISFPGLGNYAAGQLLLEGVDDKQLQSPLNAVSLQSGLRWDVTFKFAYAPRGWLNLFYFDPATPANSGFYPVSVDGVLYTPGTVLDNRGLFNARDFSDLWNPHLA